MTRVLVVGAEVSARAMRDAGDEVVYLDSATAEQVAHTAVQEDVASVVTARPDEVRAALARLDAADIDVVALPSG